MLINNSVSGDRDVLLACTSSGAHTHTQNSVHEAGAVNYRANLISKANRNPDHIGHKHSHGDTPGQKGPKNGAAS